MKLTTRQLTLCAVLTAMALALSYLENFFPLSLAIPIPGIKLGLANIVTLFALYALGPGQALLILLARCLLGAVFAGNMNALIFSLLGGVTAMGVMIALSRLKRLSVYGVSVGGAAAHNCGQVAAAVLTLGNTAPLYYLPVLVAFTTATKFGCNKLVAVALAAAMISIVVALVEMFTVSDTGPIGFLMNVLATCAFSCTAAFVYKKMHTKKGAVIGLTLGTICLTAVMILWNYLITPIYQGIPRDAIVAMLPTVFLPFNVVKGGLNMALILVLYKPVVTALRKARLVPESQTILQNKGKVNAGFLLFSIALLATFVTIALVMMGIL